MDRRYIVDQPRSNWHQHLPLAIECLLNVSRDIAPVTLHQGDNIYAYV